METSIDEMRDALDEDTENTEDGDNSSKCWHLETTQLGDHGAPIAAADASVESFLAAPDSWTPAKAPTLGRPLLGSVLFRASCALHSG